MNVHDSWRTWDKLKDCLGLAKVWMREGQYENLPRDATPDENDTEDEAEGLEDDASAAWEHESRQFKRNLEMEPSSSSSLARSEDETGLSLLVKRTHTHTS